MTMTYADAINYVLDFCESQYGDDDKTFLEVCEKLETLKVQLAKRNKHKPTKVQIENKNFKTDILTVLAEIDKPITIKELQAICPSIMGLTNQRVTRLLTDLRRDDKVRRIRINKVAHFELGKEEIHFIEDSDSIKSYDSPFHPDLLSFFSGVFQK